MRRLTQVWLLVGLAILSLGLAACGGKSKDKASSTPEPSSTPQTGGAFNPGSVGPDLSVDLSGGSGLPGCNDPNDTECPSPVVMTLDQAASAGGVTIRYPARYFDAATNSGPVGTVLIEITPSENNKYEDTATFQVYFAESIDGALAELQDPETGTWSNDTLSGTVGVVKDRTQDPPVNTTIGAFTISDGRVIVLKAVTTGQYGWNLWARVYEDMLNSLSVSG
jgi:hypothetical protein